MLYPMQTWMAWLALIKGVPAALGQHISINASENLFPHPMPIIWGSVLALGGIVILTGMARRMVTVEIAGFKILAAAMFLDVASVIILTGLRRWDYVLLYAGFVILAAIKVYALRASYDRTIGLAVAIEVATDAGALAPVAGQLADHDPPPVVPHDRS